MTRIAPTRGGLVARVSARISKRWFGKVPDPLLITAHHPGLLRGYLDFEWELSRAKKVDTKLKDLAETKAAALAGCEWCLDIATEICRKSGVTEQQIADLPRYRESPHFSELERLVLDLATGMTQTPVQVGDDLFAALRRHFDDAQLVELIGAIAWENYRARFNWAVDAEPQGFSRGACALPELPAAATSG